MIGRMPDYVTGCGYRIVPVLGVVRPGFSWSSTTHEVDAAFEVPLQLPDESGQSQPRKPHLELERERFYYTMPYRRPLHLGRDGRHHPHAL